QNPGDTVSVTGKGTITLGANGDYTFTPVANYNGAFPVVKIGRASCREREETSALTISVRAVDDQVSDANETVTVAEDSGASTGNVLMNASAVDRALTVMSVVACALPGTQNPGDTVSVTGKGTITLGANGDYTFTPVANYNGAFPVV